MYLEMAKATEASLPAVRKSCTVATPLSTCENNTYRIVQITSDPRMPIGMSRCGSLASCAAVETASKPMKAKNTTEAPRTTPDQPKWPNSPVLDGMRGCQVAGVMETAPSKMKTTTTNSLMATMMI